MRLIKKKYIVFNLILVLFFSFSGLSYAYAQKNKANTDKDKVEQKKNQNSNIQGQDSGHILSVDFVSGDIVFMYNAFNTVELKATEIDNFQLAFEKLKTIIDNPDFKKISSDTPVKVNIEDFAAEKILLFANRITLTGANVVRFKRFVSAIYEAAKAASN